MKPRKLGSLPRLCWPLSGLSVGSEASAPAVLDRSVGPSPGPTLRAVNRRQPVLSFQISRRDAQKECVPITYVLETHKGAPTNRAGTPDRYLLRTSRRLCQEAFSWQPPRHAPVQGQLNSEDGSTFTPGPMVEE